MSSIIYSLANSFCNLFSRESEQIFELSNEICNSIMVNLNARDLMSCSVVSKRFNSLINNRMWQSLNEKSFEGLSTTQKYAAAKKIANECPFVLGILKAVGPDVIFERKRPWRYEGVLFSKNKALIVCYIQQNSWNNVIFKVAKVVNKPGFAYIHYAGLKPPKPFILVPIDERLIDYVKKLVKGDNCNIFTINGEDDSMRLRHY